MSAMIDSIVRETHHRIRVRMAAWICAVFCCLVSFRSLAEDTLCRTTGLVLSSIEQNHIDPPAFSHAIKKDIVLMLLQDLDQRGIYFLDTDRQALDSLAGEEGQNAFCKLIDATAVLFARRMSETDSIAKVLLSKPLLFNTQDTVTLYWQRKRSIVLTRQDRQRRIEKVMKYSILMGMYDLLSDSSGMSRDAARDKAQKKALRLQLRTSQQLKDPSALRHHVAEKLWNAIAGRCDAHSNYFSPADYGDFETSLSSTEQTYGLVFMENNDGEMEIVRLIPGSPAWKSGSFNVGDVLTGLETPGGKALDLSALTPEEIEQLVYSPEGARMKFTVRKKNNKEERVELGSSRIQSEENFIQGFILRDSMTKVGYVSLPAFYRGSEGDFAPGCASDVAREILKLKKENIEGLVLDLRGNGGGSIQEAMDLAGIFIDEGPLAMLKEKGGKVTVLRDRNRGTVYDGPLLVLINGLSASASEFVAAVLQDYNRAVVAGTTTYGKGTGQGVVPVDSTENEKTIRSKGYLKITTIRFYRVNRSTVQSVGVIPDIELPDIFMKLDYFKEANEPFHLAPDSAAKRVAIPATSTLPREFLLTESLKRQQKKSSFQQVRLLGDSIALQRSQPAKLVLRESAAFEYFRRNDIFADLLDSVSSGASNAITVLNNRYAGTYLGINADAAEANEAILQRIRSDFEIEEAFFILKDLIHHPTQTK